MAVKIRLMRVGKKKQPTYRIVVADGRSPRDGRFIEILGQYEPRKEPSGFAVDGEKTLAWLRKGAQPTEAVEKLLQSTGVWEQYESERSKPAVTKLSRRGYKTGKVAPGVKVNYQAVGSGGGIQQFTEKTVDFGATDLPMTDEEIAAKFMRYAAASVPAEKAYNFASVVLRGDGDIAFREAWDLLF